MQNFFTFVTSYHRPLSLRQLIILSATWDLATKFCLLQLENAAINTFVIATHEAFLPRYNWSGHITVSTIDGFLSENMKTLHIFAFTGHRCNDEFKSATTIAKVVRRSMRRCLRRLLLKHFIDNSSKHFQ